MSRLQDRLDRLPTLGLGVSTEYGAFDAEGALNLNNLRESHPHFCQFLEIGVEVEKGLDVAALGWVEQRLPTTYHFLDINLDDPRDLESGWLDALNQILAQVQPAWLCGDAGLWHFGRRDRGHMLLLPPILTDDAAKAMADGIIALREATGYEVFPENPPGHVYIGDLHLLDFFARVCERADTGMLLDAAHLAIYQSTQGHSPLTGLDSFPTDRVVEMHVAGATLLDVDGLCIVEDDHTVSVLPATWTIFEQVSANAPNLKAVVFECERNRNEACLPGFQRLHDILRQHHSPRGLIR